MVSRTPNHPAHRHGFSATANREVKAAKIRAVIEATRGALGFGDLILDIGAGSGSIAASLGMHATVYATDTVDQRVERVNHTFVLSKEDLPFRSAAFDVVISNHVIEHVTDAQRHLEEIRRVTKPSGVCYLATPNRWWPFEVHSRLALLHWLPAGIFNHIARRLRRLPEPVVLLSLRELSSRSRKVFSVETWHDRVVQDPTRYRLDLPMWAKVVTKRLPTSFISWSRAWHPTIIAILRPVA